MADKYKKRADGRYAAQIRTGRYKENGKPIIITLYAESSKKLEKLVAAKKYEIEHGMVAIDSSDTFGEYAKKWLEIVKQGRMPATRSNYNNVIKNHIFCLEHKKLKDITRSDIQMQINESYKIAPSLCKIIRITIKQILDCAIDDSLIYKNVCNKIDIPENIAKEKRALTEREKKMIINADLTLKERAYVYILMGCGLRPEECRALSRQDFDFKNNTININKTIAFDGNNAYPVQKTKTRSGIRIVPMPEKTADAVKEYIDSMGDNLLLFALYDDGKNKTRSAFHNDWKKMYKKIVGNDYINYFTEYTFRHNYCTELYYSGISLKECQRLMGHANYNMIMAVYSHLDSQKENTSAKIRKLI